MGLIPESQFSWLPTKKPVSWTFRAGDEEVPQFPLSTHAYGSLHHEGICLLFRNNIYLHVPPNFPLRSNQLEPSAARQQFFSAMF